MDEEAKTCEHTFVFRGVVYETLAATGSSTRCPVNYYNDYFCNRCLTHNYELLDGDYTTWDGILHGATPRPV